MISSVIANQALCAAYNANAIGCTDQKQQSMRRGSQQLKG
jgi:hypothetical protein